MKQLTKSGSALAAAALTMAVGMAAFTAAPAQAEGNKIHCYGVNACKGQSECKSVSNSCKGLNACKSKGFATLTEDECRTRGGMGGAG